MSSFKGTYRRRSVPAPVGQIAASQKRLTFRQGEKEILETGNGEFCLWGYSANEKSTVGLQGIYF